MGAAELGKKIQAGLTSRAEARTKADDVGLDAVNVAKVVNKTIAACAVVKVSNDRNRVCGVVISASIAGITVRNEHDVCGAVFDRISVHNRLEMSTSSLKGGSVVGSAGGTVVAERRADRRRIGDNGIGDGGTAAEERQAKADLAIRIALSCGSTVLVNHFLESVGRHIPPTIVASAGRTLVCVAWRITGCRLMRAQHWAALGYGSASPTAVYVPIRRLHTTGLVEDHHEVGSLAVCGLSACIGSIRDQADQHGKEGQGPPPPRDRSVGKTTLIHAICSLRVGWWSIFDERERLDRYVWYGIDLLCVSSTRQSTNQLRGFLSEYGLLWCTLSSIRETFVLLLESQGDQAHHSVARE